MPPPRVMPPTPVVEMMPLGVPDRRHGGVVQIAQRAPALDAGGARVGIDAHAVHRREVDDQPVVDSAQPGAVVAAAADGDEDVVVSREVDRGDDVGDVDAVGDEAGRLSIIAL